MQYGNPPNLKDCTDLGTAPEMVAPRTVENEGIFAGNEVVFRVAGEKIPDVRRVWMTIRHYRGQPTPWRVRVPGLGNLVYDEQDGLENWAVL